MDFKRDRKMIKDYILIIFITTLSIFTVEHSKKEKELFEAKSLAVEFYEESENLRIALNSMNKYTEDLESNMPLLKDLL